MYPQGACRIRKAPSSPTAAQYFKLFKPQDWRKRSAEARRRNCAVLPCHYTKRARAGQDSVCLGGEEFFGELAVDKEVADHDGRAGQRPRDGVDEH
jgi:hypothetical protein